jgi:predicted dehydrogenase
MNRFAGRRPRLGFLGTGWIGRHRLQAIAAADLAEIVALADPSPKMLAEAAELVPTARCMTSLEALLQQELDGLVIATPSALHAEQSIQGLRAGLAVFCQKPLGRSVAEVDAVVREAAAADRLLSVDLSYRHTEGMRQIRELIRQGALGRIYAVNLVFHNAYGPDKPWFYDAAQSGGGCVMDLGVHLVDLALWALDFPAASVLSTQLFAQGEKLQPGGVEDYAAATLALEGGAVVQLACSWRLPLGREAQISATFHGTEGGAALRNLKGSFYDFTAERFRGTSCEVLSLPPDDWGGRAAQDWVRRLAGGEGFDPAAERLVDVARVLDSLYDR